MLSFAVFLIFLVYSVEIRFRTQNILKQKKRSRKKGYNFCPINHFRGDVQYVSLGLSLIKFGDKRKLQKQSVFSRF